MNFSRRLWFVVVAINLLIAGFIAKTVYSSYLGYVERAQTTAQNLSLALERNIGGIFDAVDLALKTLAGDYAEMVRSKEFSAARWNAKLLRTQSYLPILSGVRGADESGVLVYGVADKGLQRVDIANRHYFIAHKMSRGGGLIVSRPIFTRVSAKWSLILSRRLDDERGEFHGIVAASIPLERFSERFSTLELGSRDSIVMYDDNLRMIAHYPKLASEENGSLRIGENLKIAMQRAPFGGGYYDDPNGNGEVQRLHRYKRHPVYPFYIDVGIAKSEFLAPWWQEFFLAAALECLFLFGSIFVARRLQSAVERLRNSEEKYRILVDEASDPIYTFRRADEFDYANRAFADGVGKRPDEIVGKTLWDVYPQDEADKRFAIVKKIFESGIGENVEMRVPSSDGDRYYATTLTPSLDEQNRVKRVICNAKEITQIKRSEAELILARDAAETCTLTKSRFLAATSHDLRQPIAAIQLLNDALSRTELNESQKRICHYLSQAIHSLDELLGALLDISKLDAGAIEPCPDIIPIEAILGKLDADYSSLAAEKSLRFRLHTPRAEMRVITDSRLILSLLGNLVGNAIKYTQRGGVLVGVRRRGDRAIFQVWDSGIGIAPKHIHNIFEEYFQVGNSERDRIKGLGLGLAIVKRLAVLLKTDVVCRSRPGKGSVFEVGLPLAIDPAQACHPWSRSANDAVPVAKSYKKNIAIVEDDRVVAEALQMSLKMFGMNVVAFGSAENALANPATVKADFHIVDFRLPGMNGVCYLDALQGRSAKPIHAVLLTGDTSPGHIEATRSLHWKLLIKPVELATLLSAIASQDSDDVL